MTALREPAGASGASFSARALIGRTVRWRGVRLGTVADVLLDPKLSRALGLEVACADGDNRFLASAAYTIDGDVAATSPLALVEPAALGFYRRRGVGFAVPQTVLSERRELGRLTDAVLDASGAVREVVVEGPQGERARLPSTGLVVSDAAELP